MNIDLRFVATQNRYIQGNTLLKNNSPLPLDQSFADLLDAQLEAGGRIIPAEQVLAELDGQYEGKSAYSANPQEILAMIERTASRFGVDMGLVREVVRAESNFNPSAVSSAGAKGLMQLMDATARSLQVRDSFDPQQNLAGGVRYLRDLLQRYDGNVKVALAAYNAGPGRVDRLGIATDDDFDRKAGELPAETQKYVAKIMSRLSIQAG
ncbi:lytic transglycosylase domain-containing protein [Brevibacillus sp. B_LB10_24]|uniref:lytic transglycosylase domain-containing protein n=1 Tax=Brevibacillus sp. B_LB10_24 TaxID=3380645 RepID=UPI0038BDEF0F